VPESPSRRLVAIASAVTLCVAGAGVGLAVSRSGHRAAPVGTTSITTSANPSTTSVPATTTVPGPRPVRGLAVRATTTTFTDESRPVVSGGRTLAPVRSLPTTVWAPTPAGHYPLVVFVHGYDVGPSTYARFCTQLASSGYVVAAPSFPLEDPSRGYGLDRGDLPNEATDVSFVIGEIERSSLAASLAPSEVAVVGHSDGADVALMLGYVSGHIDPRIRAVVADAPDPISGTIQAGARTPLLLVQGDADDVVPYSSSQTVFAQLSSPRYYLTLLGATHLPPIVGGTQWTPVLDAAVAGFLDAEVAGRANPAALPSELGSSALGRLETAGIS